MRGIAAILAVVLAVACQGFVKNTLVPAAGTFLAHHYYPHMNTNVVFYIALLTLAAVFYIVLEILLHNSMKRRKAKAQQA
ncbi:MAG: hypothetical protein DMG65_14215 [Candidatus Angelobacter sp. Gp1-AA117]|nr:MAG: hypothetical protein DMG65_14215 [Candidatus Angelobacter sp. Gp1-AA117]